MPANTIPNPTHTPEPWQVVIQPSKTWVGMRSLHVCQAGDPAKVMSVAHIGAVAGTNPDEEANADRIVACVNACAGIADPQGAIRNGRHAIEDMLQVLDGAPFNPHKIHAIIRDARAALAALGSNGGGK